jgi:phytanoyl-CoA hydroxylase
MEKDEILKMKLRFNEDGYLFLPGFLDPGEVALINNKLDQFIKERVPGLQSGHVFYEDNTDSSTLKQLQDLHTYDPFFSGMLFDSKFKEIAQILLNDEVIGKNLEYFNKPPRIGKPTPPHQDNYYFMLNPSSAVTMWMALENADTENGCVRYIKGSHLKGMRVHGKTKTPGFSQGISDYGEQEDLKTEEIAFPAKPGDLLIHHAMTIHRADGNRSSSRSRKAVGFIYFGQSAKEDLAAKSAYQKLLNEERFQKPVHNNLSEIPQVKERNAHR